MKICDCTCIKRIVQWPKLSRKSQVHYNISSDGGIRIWNVTECTTGQLLGKQLSWLEYSQEAQASECWANQLVQDSHCGPRGFEDLSFPGHKSVFTVAAMAHSRSAPGTKQNQKSLEHQLMIPIWLFYSFLCWIESSSSSSTAGLTEVFFHDVSRSVEQVYAQEFLCEMNLVSSEGDLWHFQVHPSITTQFVTQIKTTKRTTPTTTRTTRSTLE